ncbi:hypothetical protein BV898_06529 [Hypsibius exemplaris]|uniref:Uncharacterized protein n=1 Tax=Hypsibius exemplaris TaxID=2072580 RepID=A0A1W0WWI1_HYPEX|nr:hypothetical protein BV898_06529 [Hypsibius exemplaris]
MGCKNSYHSGLSGTWLTSGQFPPNVPSLTTKLFGIVWRNQPASKGATSLPDDDDDDDDDPALVLATPLLIRINSSDNSDSKVCFASDHNNPS